MCRGSSTRCSAVAAPGTSKETGSVAAENGSGAREEAREGGAGGGEKPAWRASVDFKFIRDNLDEVESNIAKRKAAGDARKVVALYEEFLKQNQVVDRLRQDRNSVAASMKGKLDLAQREALVAEGKAIKERLSELEAALDRLMDELQREGQRIPNMTHPDAPVGGEEAGLVRKVVGAPRKLGFAPRDHVMLGEMLDLFDFDNAAEVSGQKFYYLKNAAVLLEMALLSWSLHKLVARGFTALSTPDLVRASVMEKCGFQPRGENTQVYTINDSDLCLAGTAEIPCGGLVMDRILPASTLPLKLAAFSHCFRTEAGAAGRENRGLYRVHQFSKLEMFVVCTPEQSDAIHEELISIEEEMYTSLGLHFKTIDMPSEDLGAPAYRKFDIEAWMPGLDKYGEVSSASNCTDYQSRRLAIRYRPDAKVETTEVVLASDAKPEKQKKAKKAPLPPAQFAHTLNATACAIPRMLIALLETHQQEDGSVVVPEPLRPYMGGLEVIRPPHSL